MGGDVARRAILPSNPHPTGSIRGTCVQSPTESSATNEKIATIKGKFRTGTKATSLAKDTPGIFKFKLDSGAAHVSVAIRHSLRYLFAHLGPTRSAPKRESGGTLSQNCRPGLQNRAWRKLLTLIRF